MKKYSNFLLLLFTVATFASCLDEISLDTPAISDGLLVIQGKLIKGVPSKIEVSITQVFDFTGFNLPKNIDNAKVELRDEVGNSIELERILGGTYELSIFDNLPDSFVEVGKSYQLFIELENGEQYESLLEPMIETPKIDAIEARLISKFTENADGEFLELPFVEYRITTPLSLSGGNEKARLKWDYTGVFKLSDTPRDTTPPKTCYVYAPINFDEVVVFDGNEASVNQLDTFPIYETQSLFSYAEGHYLTAFQESLSEGAYEYFSFVSDVIERTGNIFEEPAGKIKSNFRNINNSEEEIFGYFYAVTQDTIRILVEPEDAGFPTTLCPQPFVGGSPPNECDDCLLLNSTSLIPPDYWEM